MKKINKRNNESKYGKCFGMLVLILTLFQSAYSQETLDQYVKRIVPSSPEVASIIKYGDYPVSHTTGIPEINIPLYTVECDEVTVPISISYHSSGTKTNDIASVVGLGWTLNAGGMIHRTVNGLPDDLSSSAKNNRFVLKSEADLNKILWKLESDEKYENPWWDRDCEIIKYAGDNMYYFDTQSDIYSYSFGSYSGNFMFDIQHDSIVFIPKTTLKMKDFFEFVDNYGTQYFFKTTENTPIYASPICWYLTEIVTPHQHDTIYFEYEQRNSCSVSPALISEYYHEGYVGYPGSDFDFFSDFNYSKVSGYFNSPLLTTIKWKKNKVSFNYSTDRNEIFNNGRCLKRLSSVEVYSGKDLINKYVLTKKNLGTNKKNYRTLLDSLLFYGNNSKNPEKYSFRYYRENSYLPDYITWDTFEKDYYCHEDYWGFYNGYSGSRHFLPKEFFESEFSCKLEVHDKSSNPDASKTGVLSEITYPTGGVTKYYYSGNSNCGGLKIDKIENCIDGVCVKKTEYQYSNPIEAFNVTADLFVYKENYVYGYNVVSQGNYVPYNPSYYLYGGWYDADQSTASPSFYYFVPGRQVRWQEQVSRTNYVNKSCSSNSILPLSRWNGAPVFYQKIIETIYDGNTPCLKKIYKYTENKNVIKHYFEDNDDYPRFLSDENNYYYGSISPLLLSQEDYDYDQSSKTWLLNNSVKNVYENVGLREGSFPIVGIPVMKDFVAKTTGPLINEAAPFYCARDMARFYVGYNVYAIPNYKRLKSSVVKRNGIETTTTYTYDNGFRTLQPLSVTVKNSVGESKQSVYSYLFQNQNIQDMKDMYKDNYVDVVVGIKEYVNNKMISQSKDVYKKEAGRYLLSEKQYAVGSNPLETRLKFLRYDSKGNVQEAVQDDESHVFFIWGYNYQYPVMKIVCQKGKDVSLYNSIKDNIQKLGQSLVPDNNLMGTVRTAAMNYGEVTSYTYIPLVGMSSQTTPNGVTTYYDYDEFGRLKKVKDKDKKALSSYQYQYKQ